MFGFWKQKKRPGLNKKNFFGFFYQIGFIPQILGGFQKKAFFQLKEWAVLKQKKKFWLEFSRAWAFEKKVQAEGKLY